MESKASAVTSAAVPPDLSGRIADPGVELQRLFDTIAGKPAVTTVDDVAAALAVDEPYRVFLEVLAVAVYTTDAAGRITFFNQAAVDFWGRRPELGEEWCGSLRLFEVDGRPMAHDACPMAIALKENRAVRGTAAIAERPDGRRVAFVPHPTPLRSADGTLVGAVNVLVDITERLAAEEALRASAEALAASAEALAASNAVKDEFLGLISHELRTPVTTIFGNAVLLRDRSTIGDRERAMISDISDDSERLLRIVENLLHLTRLGAGTSLEVEPQVLEHVVGTSLDSYRRRHPEREVRLTTTPPSTVVDADSTLELVVENLVSNADKYSAPGLPIDVVISTEGSETEVHVLDRGIGLPDDEDVDVFATFYRADEARRTAGGIGVGLAVCKRIVEAHGGRMWAEPREGGGADVGFALPISLDLDA